MSSKCFFFLIVDTFDGTSPMPGERYCSSNTPRRRRRIWWARKLDYIELYSFVFTRDAVRLCSLSEKMYKRELRWISNVNVCLHIYTYTLEFDIELCFYFHFPFLIFVRRPYFLWKSLHGKKYLGRKPIYILLNVCKYLSKEVKASTWKKG
jgi:hypothetical protein